MHGLGLPALRRPILRQHTRARAHHLIPRLAHTTLAIPQKKILQVVQNLLAPRARLVLLLVVEVVVVAGAEVGVVVAVVAGLLNHQQ